jgi:hypothetical protein
MWPPGQAKYGAQHGSCHLIIMTKLHSFVHWSIHLLMFSFIYSAQLMSLPDSSNGCWPNDYMCNTKNPYIQQTLRCFCVTTAMIYNTILCQNLQDYTPMLKNYICWTLLYSAQGDIEPLFAVAPTGCTKSDPGKRQTWSMGRMIPKGRKRMFRCHCVYHKPHIIIGNNPDL